MNDYNEILDAWVMVEHLSEGDINPSKDKYLRFDDFDSGQGNYYDYFMSKCQGIKKEKYKNGGLVVYIDIFPIQDLIKFLHEKLKLESTDEETQSGFKFSCALYFDLDLNYIADKLFFTETGFIRHECSDPDKGEFYQFESDFKDKISKNFESEGEYKEVFNRALGDVISSYTSENNPLGDCMFQIAKNFGNESMFMHSSFVKDLEKAKKVQSENLSKYLAANSGVQRKNLDCKDCNDSKIFNEILDPENYPMGRFPSNTEYALSFMQQVAVSLVVSYKDQRLRSVNGPPGTGKTTILKDIFADLVVKQAKIILDDRGKSYTKIGNKIERLPDSITQNNVFVLSMNNGAVQNIVNELPLISGIDDDLKEELLNVDYFKDITKPASSDQEGDSNSPKSEVVENDKDFWGLFSLEGGASKNVKNIIEKIRAVNEYFNSGQFIPDNKVYSEFEEQYARVKALKIQAHNNKIKLETIDDKRREMQKLTTRFNKEKPKREKERDLLKAQLKEEIPRLQKSLRELESDINHLQEEINENREFVENLKLLIDEVKNLKVPFWPWSSKKVEKETRIKELTNEYAKKLANRDSLLERKKDLEVRHDEKEKDVNKKIHDYQEADPSFKLGRMS